MSLAIEGAQVGSRHDLGVQPPPSVAILAAGPLPCGLARFLFTALALAVHLINDLHGELLRRLSSSAALDFVGLTVGGSRLRSRPGPRLTNNLKQVNVAFKVLRRITDVYAQQLTYGGW